MENAVATYPMRLVALLAEGVGRNIPQGKTDVAHLLSPSSRRAWVEMALRYLR